MRIVAGRWRGRTIHAPKDARVRPTADRVREAWLAIVAPHVAGARVLDLFAGSGALGLEALSHDAAERVAERWLQVPFATLLGVEHSSRTSMPTGGVTRRYGETAITFYERDDAPPSDA